MQKGCASGNDSQSRIAPCGARMLKTPSMRYLLALLFLPLTVSAQNWQVFFSPGGGCTRAVVEQLNSAKSNVLVQAYSFTSAPIAKALVNAANRGVNVSVLLDRSQETERYTSATYLLNNEISPLIDHQHAIAHNKVMIIDQHIVITGSFNFTKAAEEKNAENVLVIDNMELANKYAENWQKHALHSRRRRNFFSVNS